MSNETESTRPPADSTPALTVDTIPPADGDGVYEEPRGPILPALLATAGVTAATAGTVSFAFRSEHAGQPIVLASIAGLNAVLLLLTVAYLKSRGRLKLIRPQGGDLSFGALVAALFYVLSLGVRAGMLDSPPRSVWLTRIYAQLGDARAVYVGIAILVLAAVEEIVWRGGVQTLLVDALGDSRGWLATTAAFALAQVPSTWLLADPVAGPNPLVVLLAVGGGGVWGLIALKTERLGICMAAHALFVWAVMQFPLTMF